MVSFTPDVIKAIKVTKRSRNWDVIDMSESTQSPKKSQNSPEKDTVLKLKNPVDSSEQKLIG